MSSYHDGLKNIIKNKIHIARTIDKYKKNVRHVLYFKQSEAGGLGMHCTEKALAVLVDPGELGTIFADWPTEMFLSICLLPNGECQLVVFREEEYQIFLPRLEKHLGLSHDEICVVPKVDGYPTRTLLYSDERRLMRLVADSPGIIDEAADYSVNFGFALEEGMNPAHLLGFDGELALALPETGSGGGTPPASAPEPSRPVLSLVETAASERAVAEVSKQAPSVAETTFLHGADTTRRTLPRFLQVADEPVLGPEYRSARQIGADESASETYHVMGETAGWLVIERPGALGRELRVRDPEKLFLRDDGQVLAVAADDEMAANDLPPARLKLRIAAMPRRLRDAFEQHSDQLKLTREGDFVFLHFLGPRTEPVPERKDEAVAAPIATAGAPAADVQSEVATLSRAKRWRKIGQKGLLGLSAAMLLLALLGLTYVDGIMPTGGDDATGPSGWGKFRLSQQVEQAR